MALRDRVLIKFPAIVNVTTGIGKTFAAGVYEFFLDFRNLVQAEEIADPSSSMVLLYTPDPVDPTQNGQYSLVPVADFGLEPLSVQTVTSGNALILTDANIVRVNQSSPAASTLTLPFSSGKVGDVLVVDWKGDARTNNVTIIPSGSETFQGGLTSFKLDGDGASASFRPIPGVGYAI